MKRSMTNNILRWSLCAIFLLSGWQSAQAQLRRGSIYNPALGPYGPVANKTARRKGDLITVVISESQDIKNEESTDFSKVTDLNYQLTNFDIASNAFNPLPALAAGSTDTFSGTATYEKKGEFTARMTAIVIDTLPNGNLVISGRREIRIDRETKVLEFSGVVRRYDISAANTVQSEQVANATVVYAGKGPLTNTTNRRGIGSVLHSAISWLWPF